MRFRFAVRVEEQLLAKGRKLPKLYVEYMEFCSKTKGLSEYTIRLRRKYLLPFLLRFPKCGHSSSVAKISAKDVHDYIIRSARKLSRDEKKHVTSALRDFLRYIFMMEYHEQDLSKHVPKIVMARLAAYPKGLPWDVIKKLLKSPNRRTLQGKRDYAMLLLLTRYGVRPRQLINLKLKDIDWRGRTILFRAIKGGKDVVVPLHHDVAKALLSYFKAGRMNVRKSLDEVFLTLVPNREHEAPFTTPFYYMFDQYLRKIPFAGPQWRGGPSAIRHSVASKLLSENNSIKTIADLFGHRSIETTYIYTKVDLKRLSALALEWPEVA